MKFVVTRFVLSSSKCIKIRFRPGRLELGASVLMPPQQKFLAIRQCIRLATFFPHRSVKTILIDVLYVYSSSK